MVFLRALAAVLLLISTPGVVVAAPIASGSTLIAEDNGFPGVCSAPCFNATLDFEVWAPDDPDNPLPSVGSNTYLYKLTHTGGTLAFPSIPLTGLMLEVDLSDIVAFGVVSSAMGIAPVSFVADPLGFIDWTFPATASCPNCLDEGQMSSRLFVFSPLEPGLISGDVTALVLDRDFTTTGPLLGSATVPESATLFLFSVGLFVLGLPRRRR